MMPAFKQMEEREKQELLGFLLKTKNSNSRRQKTRRRAGYPKRQRCSDAKEPATEAGAADAKNNIMDEVKYNMTGYNRFTDKDGYPGIKPPWGTLNAVI